MPWEVEFTNEFQEWFADLSDAQQQAVAARVRDLELDGPQVRRPIVGLIQSSRHQNMKELICNREGSLRVLFMFDPRRTAILLLGGNKTGEWEAWYREFVPVADAIYDDYIREIREEGLL